MLNDTLHVGDTQPALTGTATTDGVGADLSGAALELHIRRSDLTILSVTPLAVDAPSGTWSYAWAVGDLNGPGRWECELEVTYAGGGIQTFGPAAFTVVKQIA